jgi:hypothetical protein
MDHMWGIKTMLMTCFVHGGERSWKYQSHSHNMDHMWGIKTMIMAQVMSIVFIPHIWSMMCECDWYFQLHSPPCTKQAMIIVFIPHIWSSLDRNFYTFEYPGQLQYWFELVTNFPRNIILKGVMKIFPSECDK